MEKLLKIHNCILLIRNFHLKSLDFSKTHYELLNINRNCSQKDVRKAFINLSKKLHPDANQGDHSQFIKINEAYMILNDINKRKDYDNTLKSSSTHYTDNYDDSRSYSSSKKQYRTGFHDETIFSMRDKSKDHDAFYPKDSYYGIKGVNRVSNFKMSLLSFIIIFIGFLLFLGALSVSDKRIRYDTHRQTTYLQNITDARERALNNGNEKQLEILSDIMKKSQD